uniref:Uncharacterized protein n=1 Tax=Panagrolaimus sp. JU765 TaxID=591449 RepID=A0AC34QSY5_9BILA
MACVMFGVNVLGEEKVHVEEQLDPFGAQRLQYPFGNGMNGMANMPTMNGGGFGNTAKSPTANTNVPTDANAAAQQQIQQLNEQIRRLQEQLRRQQQGASAFEQFAQMLSQADGLDCNCSGSSSPFSNMYQNGAMNNGAMNNGNFQNTAFGQGMNQQPRFASLSGLPFAQRMTPAMIPQIQGPMFPMKI